MKFRFVDSGTNQQCAQLRICAHAEYVTLAASTLSTERFSKTHNLVAGSGVHCGQAQKSGGIENNHCGRGRF